MKKIILSIFAVLATASVYATPVTVTKSVAELAETYQWKNDQCYYRPFALDEVITVSSTDGNAKYLEETKDQVRYQKMRYYQNTDKGYGSMIFTAKPGYVITSIKLNYTQQAANSVACVHWYNGNQKASILDTLAIGVARSFHSPQVVLYVGRTSDLTGGQIRVTEYSVTYEKEDLDVRILTRSSMDMAMQYNQANGTHPIHMDFNDVISIHSDPSTWKYYVNNRAFTCYQNNGGIWFKARKGAIITKMRIIYYPGIAENKEGVLVQNFVNSGKAVAKADRIASNQEIIVNSDSVHFNAGNIYDATGAQILVTGVHIEYIDTLSQMETYANLNAVAGTEEVKFDGENGIYKWKVNNFAHRDTCAMYDYTGIRLFYGGALASDGEMEGGVKNVSFEWRMSNQAKENNNMTNPAKFMINAGEWKDTCQQKQTIVSAGHYMNYNKEVAMKSNCAFSIALGEKEATAQAMPILGPVTIAPYVLYTEKTISLAAKDYTEAGYKYTNKALINNADAGEVVYSVEGENADKIASVDAQTGEVTMLGEGTVTVKAAVGQAYTTYELTIALEDAELAFAKADTTISVLDGTFQQVPSKATTAEVIYSVEGEAGEVSIDQDGTVHFTEAGVLTISAKVAQEVPYLADSVAYTLTINRAKAEVGFAEDTVMKKDNDEPFTNMLTTPVGVGDTTYVSSADTVVTVNAQTGEVTIVGVGTATITASVAQSGIYEAAEASYVVVVEAHDPTGLKNVNANVNANRKVIVNGQMRIYIDGKCYNVLGKEIMD